MTAPKYKRILLKLSGEAFKGSSAYGFDSAVISKIALQIKHVSEMGVQVAIVVGGGNIWRGQKLKKMAWTELPRIMPVCSPPLSTP